VIPIPEDLVDRDKIKATFKKGVLKLTLPKIPGKETKAKKIDINAED
jgi:HSP20 family protein